MQVWVLVARNGKVVELDCSAGTRIEALQQALASVTGIPLSQQLLMHNGEHLHSSKRVSAYERLAQMIADPSLGRAEIFLYDRRTMRPTRPGEASPPSPLPEAEEEEGLGVSDAVPGGVDCCLDDESLELLVAVGAIRGARGGAAEAAEAGRPSKRRGRATANEVADEGSRDEVDGGGAVDGGDVRRSLLSPLPALLSSRLPARCSRRARLRVLRALHARASAEYARAGELEESRARWREAAARLASELDVQAAAVDAAVTLSTPAIDGVLRGLARVAEDARDAADDAHRALEDLPEDLEALGSVLLPTRTPHDASQAHNAAHNAAHRAHPSQHIRPTATPPSVSYHAHPAALQPPASVPLPPGARLAAQSPRHAAQSLHGSQVHLAGSSTSSSPRLGTAGSFQRPIQPSARTSGDARGIDPRAADPRAADPRAADPRAADPRAADPRSTSAFHDSPLPPPAPPPPPAASASPFSSHQHSRQGSFESAPPRAVQLEGATLPLLAVARSRDSPVGSPSPSRRGTGGAHAPVSSPLSTRLGTSQSGVAQRRALRRVDSARDSSGPGRAGSALDSPSLAGAHAPAPAPAPSSSLPARVPGAGWAAAFAAAAAAAARGGGGGNGGGNAQGSASTSSIEGPGLGLGAGAGAGAPGSVADDRSSSLPLASSLPSRFSSLARGAGLGSGLNPGAGSSGRAASSGPAPDLAPPSSRAHAPQQHHAHQHHQPQHHYRSRQSHQQFRALESLLPRRAVQAAAEEASRDLAALEAHASSLALRTEELVEAAHALVGARPAVDVRALAARVADGGEAGARDAARALEALAAHVDEAGALLARAEEEEAWLGQDGDGDDGSDDDEASEESEGDGDEGGESGREERANDAGRSASPRRASGSAYPAAAPATATAAATNANARGPGLEAWSSDESVGDDAASRPASWRCASGARRSARRRGNPNEEEGAGARATRSRSSSSRSRSRSRSRSASPRSSSASRRRPLALPGSVGASSRASTPGSLPPSGPPSRDEVEAARRRFARPQARALLSNALETALGALALAREALAAKRRMGADASAALGVLSGLQSELERARRRGAAVRALERRLREACAALAAPRELALAWRAAARERLRRAAFAARYEALADALAERMGKLRERELAARQRFRARADGALPVAFLDALGLLAEPPSCHVTVRGDPREAPVLDATEDDLLRAEAALARMRGGDGAAAHARSATDDRAAGSGLDASREDSAGLERSAELGGQADSERGIARSRLERKQGLWHSGIRSHPERDPSHGGSHAPHPERDPSHGGSHAPHPERDPSHGGSHAPHPERDPSHGGSHAPHPERDPSHGGSHAPHPERDPSHGGSHPRAGAAEALADPHGLGAAYGFDAATADGSNAPAQSEHAREVVSRPARSSPSSRAAGGGWASGEGGGSGRRASPRARPSPSTPLSTILEPRDRRETSAASPAASEPTLACSSAPRGASALASASASPDDGPAAQETDGSGRVEPPALSDPRRVRSVGVSSPSGDLRVAPASPSSSPRGDATIDPRDAAAGASYGLISTARSSSLAHSADADATVAAAGETGALRCEPGSALSGTPLSALLASPSPTPSSVLLSPRLGASLPPSSAGEALGGRSSDDVEAPVRRDSDSLSAYRGGIPSAFVSSSAAEFPGALPPSSGSPSRLEGTREGGRSSPQRSSRPRLPARGSESAVDSPLRAGATSRGGGEDEDQEEAEEEEEEEEEEEGGGREGEGRDGEGEDCDGVDDASAAAAAASTVAAATAIANADAAVDEDEVSSPRLRGPVSRQSPASAVRGSVELPNASSPLGASLSRPGGPSCKSSVRPSKSLAASSGDVEAPKIGKGPGQDEGLEEDRDGPDALAASRSGARTAERRNETRVEGAGGRGAGAEEPGRQSRRHAGEGEGEGGKARRGPGRSHSDDAGKTSAERATEDADRLSPAVPAFRPRPHKRTTGVLESGSSGGSVANPRSLPGADGAAAPLGLPGLPPDSLAPPAPAPPPATSARAFDSFAPHAVHATLDLAFAALPAATSASLRYDGVASPNLSSPHSSLTSSYVSGSERASRVGAGHDAGRSFVPSGAASGAASGSASATASSGTGAGDGGGFFGALGAGSGSGSGSAAASATAGFGTATALATGAPASAPAFASASASADASKMPRQTLPPPPPPLATRSAASATHLPVFSPVLESPSGASADEDEEEHGTRGDANEAEAAERDAAATPRAAVPSSNRSPAARQAKSRSSRASSAARISHDAVAQALEHVARTVRSSGRIATEADGTKGAGGRDGL